MPHMLHEIASQVVMLIELLCLLEVCSEAFLGCGFSCRFSELFLGSGMRFCLYGCRGVVKKVAPIKIAFLSHYVLSCSAK